MHGLAIGNRRVGTHDCKGHCCRTSTDPGRVISLIVRSGRFCAYKIREVPKTVLECCIDWVVEGKTFIVVQKPRFDLASCSSVVCMVQKILRRGCCIRNIRSRELDNRRDSVSCQIELQIVRGFGYVRPTAITTRTPRRLRVRGIITSGPETLAKPTWIISITSHFPLSTGFAGNTHALPWRRGLVSAILRRRRCIWAGPDVCSLEGSKISISGRHALGSRGLARDVTFTSDLWNDR